MIQGPGTSDSIRFALKTASKFGAFIPIGMMFGINHWHTSCYLFYRLCSNAAYSPGAGVQLFFVFFQEKTQDHRNNNVVAVIACILNQNLRDSGGRYISIEGHNY
jgi:hypothetical protein